MNVSEVAETRGFQRALWSSRLRASSRSKSGSRFVAAGFRVALREEDSSCSSVVCRILECKVDLG